MDELEDFIELLREKLQDSLPKDYVVQAREPDESELKVEEGVERQVFIVWEGAEPHPQGAIADGGMSIPVSYVLTVACVMRRPRVTKHGQQGLKGEIDIKASEEASKSIRKRRQEIIRCLGRTIRDYSDIHSHVLAELLEEMPRYVEGFYVAAAGVSLRFNLKL